MNISTRMYRSDNGPGYEHLAGTSTLEQDLAEHRFIMSRAGEILTGVVALLPESRGDDYPNSLRVWSMTAEGDWVYVTPEGVIERSSDPMNEEW